MLGYHSEEGWTAALRLLSSHYGMEAEVKTANLSFWFSRDCLMM